MFSNEITKKPVRESVVKYVNGPHLNRKVNKVHCTFTPPTPVEEIALSRPQVEVDLTRSVVIRVKGADFALRFSGAFSTVDLYKYIDQRAAAWTKSKPAYAIATYIKGSLYFNGKPLSRRAIALAEYGIANNSVLTYKFALGLGGVGFGPDGLTNMIYRALFKKLGLADMETERVSQLSEAVMVLFRQYQISTSYEQVYLASVSFIQVTCGTSAGTQFKKMFAVISEMIKGLFSDDLNVQGESDDSYNPFSDFRKYFVMFEEGIDHPVIQKLKNIFYYLMAHAFLEPFGISFDTFYFNKATAEAQRMKYNCKVGFAYSVMDGFTYIFERLYDVYKTGSWNPIIHSGKSYAKWIDLVYSIKEDIQKLHNPEATGVCYHELLGRIDLCVEQGELIVQYVKNSKTGDEKQIVKRLLGEIRVIQANEFTRKASQQEREAPFGVLLYGGSSVGKSSVSSIMFNHFGKLHNLPTTSEYKYNRCFTDEYWSSFRTSMWFIQLDDIAARNATLADDESLAEVLHIINNVGYTPPQADLADKGKTPLRPSLVTGTTNVKHLNAYVYYENTLAILRRFKLHVEVIPKKEYSVGCAENERTRMLDASKLPPITEDAYPDYWEFIVSEVKCAMSNGKQTGKIEAVARFTDINAFLAYYSKMTFVHKQQQISAMNADKSFGNIKICGSCYIPSSVCPCLETQMYDTLATIGVGLAGLIYNYPSISRSIAKHCIRGALNSVSPLLQDILYEAGTEIVCQTIIDIRQSVKNSAFSWQERLYFERDKLRNIMLTFGDNLRATLENNKILCGLLIAAPTICFIYKTYQDYSRLNIQGTGMSREGISSKIGTTIDAQDEKPNPWINNDYVVSDFDVGRFTSSLKTAKFDDIRDRIFKNCVHLKASYYVGDELRHRRGKAVCLGGNIYMTNKHNIPDGEIEMTMISSPDIQGVTQNVTFLLLQDSIIFNESKDLAFFVATCCPPKRSILEFFAKENFRTVCEGYLLQRTDAGYPKALALRGITRQDNYYVNDFGRSFPSWFAQSVVDTESGDCGSVMLGKTPLGPVIMGIHQTGGKFNQVTSIQIFRSDLNCIEHLLNEMFSPTKPKLVDLQGSDIVVDPLHHKSVFRYMEAGTASVYGSLPGFRPKHKSKVMKTYIHDNVVARGYEVKTDKPVMMGWAPWRLGAIDIVQQKYQMRTDILDECVQSFTDDILKSLSNKDMSELVVLNDSATLNGLPGVRFVDKMKRNTSMGFPWRRKKSLYLKQMGQVEQWQDYVEFDEEIYDNIDEIITKYRNKERCMPIFTGHLKDEPIAFAKIESKKTRIFAGAPADWCFVVRKYLLSFTRVLQNNKFIFESAPGTNATSTEWGDIYRYLTQFGEDRIIAGDYSKFDKNMSAQVILAAFKIIKNILKEAGWTEEDLQIVTGISFDTAFPVMDFNGDLVEFYGSNPSGQPLTVIINGLVNSLYVRYVWRAVGNDLKDFKSNVSLMTYGDDNIMGVNKKVKNFDHTIMQEILGNVNVKYTMADKLAKSVPFINIADSSFLKRSWRYEPEVGDYLCPIEEDSIGKSLTKCLPSSDKCPEAHAVDILNNTVREYFNYGKEIFQEKRQMCLDIVAEANLQPYYITAFPTWDEMKISFLEK
jgi:hypothetical protein